METFPTPPPPFFLFLLFFFPRIWHDWKWCKTIYTPKLLNTRPPPSPLSNFPPTITTTLLFIIATIPNHCQPPTPWLNISRPKEISGACLGNVVLMVLKLCMVVRSAIEMTLPFAQSNFILFYLFYIFFPFLQIYN